MAPSAGVGVAVPYSVGAGVALHVAVYNHLVSCTSPSPSDRNCLARLEELWVLLCGGEQRGGK